jgi:hypothetical protein
MALAQTTFELRGSLIDVGTGLPVVGRTVFIVPVYTGNEQLGSRKGAEIQTNNQGQFSFRTEAAGTYAVNTDGSNLIGPGQSVGGGILQQVRRNTRAVLDAQHPVASVTIEIEQRGVIRGRMVDAGTDEPLSAFSFSVLQYTKRIRTESVKEYQSATTDAQGFFHMELPTGKWLIDTAQESRRPLPLMMREFAEKDAEAVDVGYRSRLFPGGGDLKRALPMQLTPGTPIDMGTIRVSNDPLYRLRLKVTGACKPGEAVSLWWDKGSLNNLPCENEVLILGLSPGTYRFEGLVGKKNQGRAVGNLTVLLGERNQNAALVLNPGGTMTGRIFAATGTDLVREKARVMILPVGSFSERIVVSPGELAAPAWPGPYTVRLEKPDGDYYIRNIRYRGEEIKGSTFEFTGSGDVEVEVAGNPASVAGSVEDKDAPVQDAWVFIARGEDLIQGATTNAKGSFEARNLIPGEYLVFAVPMRERDHVDDVTWSRLLSRAKRAKLSNGPNRLDVTLDSITR